MDERTKIAMEAYRMMYATQVEETEELSEGPLQDLGTTASYVLGGGAKGAEERRNKDLATAKRLGDIRAGRTPEGGMRSSDLGALRSALKQSYEPEGEMVDEASYSAKAARAGKDIGKPGKAFAKIAQGAAERYGSKERGEKVAGAVLAKLRKEDVDIFDTILDYLVSEGYADTNENALVIMANMSEEWRQSIVEEVLGENIIDTVKSFAGLAKDPKTKVKSTTPMGKVVSGIQKQGDMINQIKSGG